MFDIDRLKEDWGKNGLDERSLRCKDLAFFDDAENDGSVAASQAAVGDMNTIGTSIRHGVYAYSSKDWSMMKSKFEQETKDAQEKKKIELGPEVYEQKQKDKEARAIKKKLLPTKVVVAEEADLGFGFCEDEDEEDKDDQIHGDYDEEAADEFDDQ